MSNTSFQLSVSSGVLLMGTPLPVAWLWFCMIQLQVIRKHLDSPNLTLKHWFPESTINILFFAGDEWPLWIPFPSSLLTRIPWLSSPQVSPWNITSIKYSNPLLIRDDIWCNGIMISNPYHVPLKNYSAGTFLIFQKSHLFNTGFTPAMAGLAFGTGSMAPMRNLTNPACTGDLSPHFWSLVVQNILCNKQVEEGHNFHLKIHFWTNFPCAVFRLTYYFNSVADWDISVWSRARQPVSIILTRCSSKSNLWSGILDTTVIW